MNLASTPEEPARCVGTDASETQRRPRPPGVGCEEYDSDDDDDAVERRWRDRLAGFVVEEAHGRGVATAASPPPARCRETITTVAGGSTRSWRTVPGGMLPDANDERGSIGGGSRGCITVEARGAEAAPGCGRLQDAMTATAADQQQREAAEASVEDLCDTFERLLRGGLIQRSDLVDGGFTDVASHLLVHRSRVVLREPPIQPLGDPGCTVFSRKRVTRSASE